MKTIIKQIKYLIRKSNASKIGVYSAQAAFFLFLSLIPLLMLLLTFLQKSDSLSNELIAVTDEFAPEFVNSFLKIYVDTILDESRASLTIVSSIFLLWSASKSVFAVICGLNSVYEIRETRNYFLLRIISMFYTVAFIGIIIIASAIMVFGGNFSKIITSLFSQSKNLVYLLSSMRFVLAFLILVAFFLIVYKTLPNRKNKFGDQFPGAMISAAGWVAYSIAFSFFVENFSNYASIYGSLTTITVLMLWLYVCMYIMFFGALINVVLLYKK